MTDAPILGVLPLAEKCHSCPALVFRLRHTRTGKLAPINAKPEKGGKIIILPPDQYYVSSLEPAMGHTSHFSNCPAAAKYRRGK